MKHKYSYICDACGYLEELEQERGQPRKHRCQQESCNGTCNRVPSVNQEAVFDAYTPGFASQSHKENRSANTVMTKLRMSAGGEPITDPDHMAVERHAGLKNKVIPGNSGEKV